MRLTPWNSPSRSKGLSRLKSRRTSSVGKSSTLITTLSQKARNWRGSLRQAASASASISARLGGSFRSHSFALVIRGPGAGFVGWIKPTADPTPYHVEVCWVSLRSIQPTPPPYPRPRSASIGTLGLHDCHHLAHPNHGPERPLDKIRRTRGHANEAQIDGQLGAVA